MTIRYAKQSDREILIEFLLQMFLETQKDGFKSNILPTRANAELLFERAIAPAIEAGDPVLIAEEGRPLGFIACCIRRDGFELAEPAAFGSGAFVHPEFRNHGITKSLMAKVEELLRAAGVRVWEEAVFCGNIFPQAILNAMGFEHAMRVYRKELT